ncbi:MAG: hypothetical protein GTN93_19860, partial [Anaerolineae bacterium]|nr:hypothetical protein [Anaerolineae bacterium]
NGRYLMISPQRPIYPLKPGSLPADTYLTEQALHEATYHQGVGQEPIKTSDVKGFFSILAGLTIGLIGVNYGLKALMGKV